MGISEVAYEVHALIGEMLYHVIDNSWSEFFSFRPVFLRFRAYLLLHFLRFSCELRFEFGYYRDGGSDSSDRVLVNKVFADSDERRFRFFQFRFERGNVRGFDREFRIVPKDDAVARFVSGYRFFHFSRKMG